MLRFGLSDPPAVRLAFPAWSRRTASPKKRTDPGLAPHTSVPAFARAPRSGRKGGRVALAARFGRKLHKEAWYPRTPAEVWVALTDSRALAEWLMPNNFEAKVGRVFRFHVDPMPGFSGISECRVLEVDPPRRLVYTWVVLPKAPSATPPPPMTLTWTLAEERGGTRLTLEQEGIDVLNWWWRFSMSAGWSRMLRRLLPRVLARVEGGKFTPGAISRRDHGTRTVPPGYSR